jgi:cell wall-associated NlpC family hydrolase
MLPAWVSDYIGTPYLKGAQARSGADCWGLFRLVWREQMGADIPDYAGPLWEMGADAKAIGAAASAFAAQFEPIEQDAARLGDGVLLRVRGAPIHIGFVLAPGLMLHIEETCQAVTERYDGRAWANRIVSIYRYTPPALEATA